MAEDKIRVWKRKNRLPRLGSRWKLQARYSLIVLTLKTLAQALAVSLPGPYGAIGAILATWGIGRIDQIGTQRLREQFALLAEQLKTLEGRAVRRDYFETGEGHDMLIKAFDEARRTRSRLKKELYAQILKGAILDFENKEYSSDEYLYLISDLTEKEIKVALSAYEEQLPPNEGGWKTWAEKVGGQVDMDPADLRFALGRIVSSGLLDRVGFISDEDGIGFYEPAENEVGLYRVTPGFRKLMSFVEREE